MMRTFDMFCGGGGSSYGAEAAGAEIVGGIDSWSLATEVFADNFPGSSVFNARVENYDPKRIEERVGPIDLLLASPECTNHSCARGGRPREDASRETAFQVVRYARVIKPRWIIIENVIYMRSWDRYEEFLQSLRYEGYLVSEHVLNAAEHGVPQNRKRLFIVCDREAEPPSHISNSQGSKLFAECILDKPGTWDISPLHNGRRAAATLERAQRGISVLGENERFLIVYYGTDGSGGWQSLTEPLRTITTLDRFALCEPSKAGPTIRMLQPPELTRAMGFNQNFVLKRGTRRDKIKILGNGVCPPVMAAIVRTLIT